MSVGENTSVVKLEIADLDFQTMPAGATSVKNPGLLGVAVFLIIIAVIY